MTDSINERNYITAPGSTPVDWENYAKNLLLIVCRHFQVTREEIKTPNRSREFLEPRQAVCYLMRKHVPRLSLTKIGQMIGRHHATVLHAEQQAINLIQHNAEYRSTLKFLDKLADVSKRSTEPTGSALTVGKIFPLPEKDQINLIKQL